MFYLKMKADYRRYLAEFQSGDGRAASAEATLEAYTAAQDKALAELPSTNPIRLGLALNFSVFYYEVMSQPEKACSLAKQVRVFFVSLWFLLFASSFRFFPSPPPFFGTFASHS